MTQAERKTQDRTEKLHRDEQREMQKKKSFCVSAHSCACLFVFPCLFVCLFVRIRALDSARLRTSVSAIYALLCWQKFPLVRALSSCTGMAVLVGITDQATQSFTLFYS
jgi:hypothetical protein